MVPAKLRQNIPDFVVRPPTLLSGFYLHVTSVQKKEQGDAKPSQAVLTGATPTMKAIIFYASLSLSLSLARARFLLPMFTLCLTFSAPLAPWAGGAQGPSRA